MHSIKESGFALAGKLVADERIEAKKYMLDQTPYLRDRYDEHDDNTEVLYFDEIHATLSGLNVADEIIL